MSTNPFVLDTKDYKREIDPVNQYRNQAATFLSTMTGKPVDECLAFVTQTLNDPSIGAKDPKIKFLEREENGDRVQKESTLMGYINSSLKNRELIAPTLTTYLHPEVKESLLVEFIEDNIAARGKAKKEEFAAEAAGDKLLKSVKNIEQTNAKLSNNAVSGAHVSPSTPLYNPTAHSTLTSMCRSTSGYGNANNEKLLCGNRHYWSPAIVINNITAIITNTDYNILSTVLEKYNLIYPTVEDTLKCINYSSKHYWHSVKKTNEIVSYVKRLTALQRAAFVYTGDLYHLKEFNPDFVKVFLSKLSSKITGTMEDSFKYIKEAKEDYVILAHQICAKELKGKGKDYVSMKGTPELDTLALTTDNIKNVLLEYSDVIRAFWITSNVPASVAYFPESIRHAAITSDTDSTIFTVQDWVIWYKNGISFDEEATALAATMIFLASQAIIHVLARMSANAGIVEKRLFKVAMKSEFFFPVFVPTNVAKHYYASISCQEGNIKKELEIEIKGVHLKSSNAPKKITKLAQDMMKDILFSVGEGKQLSIRKYLKEVADAERSIIESIKRGDTEFFRLGEIKTPSSYKNPSSSQYVYHSLWQEAFSIKYGCDSVPPYPTIRISTNLENTIKTKDWLENMADKELSARIKDWMVKNNKTTLPSLAIPLEVTKSKGIPDEILSVIEIRKIVADLTNILRLILETLGTFIPDKQLVSDRY